MALAGRGGHGPGPWPIYSPSIRLLLCVCSVVSVLYCAFCFAVILCGRQRGAGVSGGVRAEGYTAPQTVLIFVVSPSL